MEPVVFEDGDVHMRGKHGIFEVFWRNRIFGSYRVPLSWLKVRAEARRASLTRLHFGSVKEPDEPLSPAFFTGSPTLVRRPGKHL